METEKKKTSLSWSWLDLRTQVTELILERLPIASYIRFAAVCRKWLSIQTHHSSLPPPMLPLPWLLIANYSRNNHNSSYYFYSPFEHRFYHHPSTLPLITHHECLASSRGFSLQPGICLSLLNLTSSTRTPLPPLPIQNEKSILAAMYISELGGGVILVNNRDKLYLFRLSNGEEAHHWVELAFSVPSGLKIAVVAIVCCGGKFYCYWVGEDPDGILVVDPNLACTCSTPHCRVLADAF